eukprot:1867234-Pleurochrysis_carterae.AAC.1
MQLAAAEFGAAGGMAAQVDLWMCARGVTQGLGVLEGGAQDVVACIGDADLLWANVYLGAKVTEPVPLAARDGVSCSVDIAADVRNLAKGGDAG